MGSHASITGTGSYLPEKILTNDDIAKLVDTSDEWIQTRTGINAARRAIDAAGIDVNEIDLIVVATTTADQVFPSTACLLQSRLGCLGGPAFDVQAVCTGFVYALSVAEKFIATGSSKKALVVGAETFSRILDWNDRNTCVLFGDGAGAVVLEASESPGILSTHLYANGDYASLLHVPSGVSNNYPAVQEGRAYVEMEGSEVFKMAVRKMGEVVDEALEANNLAKSDVDWLVPHQANQRIISATAKKLGLSMDKVVLTVGEHALDTAVRRGDIKAGEMVLIEAFGGGFTWGSALFRY